MESATQDQVIIINLTAGELEHADVVVHGVVRELHTLAHYCDVTPEKEEISRQSSKFTVKSAKKFLNMKDVIEVDRFLTKRLSTHL